VIFTGAFLLLFSRARISNFQKALFIAVGLGLGGEIIWGRGLYVNRFFSFFAFAII
jgi:hypothetical protein